MMNGSLFRLGLLLAAVYATSFVASALYLKLSKHEIRGVRGPGLHVARLLAVREFSDVVKVPGVQRVLMVEDEDSTRIFSIAIDRLYDTAPPIESIPLPAGFTLKDMEGIAADTEGNVYVISSHSLNSVGLPRRGSALAKLHPSPGGGFSRAETIRDLRPWLESEIPEIAAVSRLPADAGGLNIEGLAFDPAQNRLILGLRGPLFNNHPALIPLLLPPPGQSFARAHLTLEKPIVLDAITGFGIRAISYDGSTQGFWLLTGGGGNSEKTKNRFQIWSWSVRGAGPTVLRVNDIHFEKHIRAGREKFKLHPEGLSEIRLPNSPPLLLAVTDGTPFYFIFDISRLPASVTLRAGVPAY